MGATLELTGTLHAIDRDGATVLLGDVGPVQVEVTRDGSVSLAYDYPPAGRYSGRVASLSLDVPRRTVWLALVATPRLLGLRRQAMRKGCRGWRAIR